MKNINKNIFSPKDDYDSLSENDNPRSEIPILLGIILSTSTIVLFQILFGRFGSFKNMCCALTNSGGGGGSCNNNGGPTSCSEADFIGDGAPDCGREDCSYCGPKYHPPPY